MTSLFALSCNGTLDSDGEAADSVFGDLEYLWLVGIGCSIFSSMATALGTILQKKAHNIQEALPDDQKSFEFIGIVFNKYWLFALFIMVLIPLPFDFASFALAPQSVIVPMTGLTIVLNQAFAPKLLGETLTRVELIGTAVILVGVVVIAVTAGGNPEEFNVCQLVSRYKDADVLGIVFAIVGLVALCLFWVHTHRHPVFLEKARPEMFAFIAGGLGGLMNVAFKATGELVKGEVGPAQTDTWATIWPYFHIMAVAVLAIGMISYINRGLQLYDAILFTPLYFTNLIVCSTTLGLIYYKEYTKFRTWQAVVFPFGLVIVISGILFMSVKGVDLSRVRVRAKRLEESREARKSLANSQRANGSARTLGTLFGGSRGRGLGSSARSIGHGSSVADHDDDNDDDGGHVSPAAPPVAAAASNAGSLRDAMRRGITSLRDVTSALVANVRPLSSRAADKDDGAVAPAELLEEEPRSVTASGDTSDSRRQSKASGRRDDDDDDVVETRSRHSKASTRKSEAPDEEEEEDDNNAEAARDLETGSRRSSRHSSNSSSRQDPANSL